MLHRFASILLTLSLVAGCQISHVPKGTATVTAVASKSAGPAIDEAFAYRSHVIGAIETKWKEYAEKYRTELPSGRATAEFTLDEFGTVRSVRFVEQPKHSLFRKVCEYSIRNSQFDAPPSALLKDGLQAETLRFTLH
jgi:outer membrane biosynthesis protein TonB